MRESPLTRRGAKSRSRSTSSRARARNPPDGRNEPRARRRAEDARGAGAGTGPADRGSGRTPAGAAGGRRLLRRLREGLTNVGKYAQAAPRRPSTSDSADGRLVVEIVDDGVGGADTHSGLGSARSRRPGRGAGRPTARLEPAGGGTRVKPRSFVRVVLAEDGVLLREGVRLLGDAGFEVVGQRATADDLLLKAQSYTPTSRSSTSAAAHLPRRGACAAHEIRAPLPASRRPRALAVRRTAGREAAWRTWLRAWATC